MFFYKLCICFLDSIFVDQSICSIDSCQYIRSYFLRIDTKEILQFLSHTRRKIIHTIGESSQSKHHHNKDKTTKQRTSKYDTNQCKASPPQDRFFCPPKRRIKSMQLISQVYIIQWSKGWDYCRTLFLHSLWVYLMCRSKLEYMKICYHAYCPSDQEYKENKNTKSMYPIQQFYRRKIICYSPSYTQEQHDDRNITIAYISLHKQCVFFAELQCW